MSGLKIELLPWTKIRFAGSVTEAKLLARLQFYGGLCWMCRERPYQVFDHVIPTSANGLDLASNLRPACRSCNSKKGGSLRYTPWVEPHLKARQEKRRNSRSGLTFCKCASCEHEWMTRRGRGLPKRCPNHDCRSPKWRGAEET